MRLLNRCTTGFLIVVIPVVSTAQAAAGWAHIYGGPLIDYFVETQLTADGGCVAVGSTESFGAQGRDIWMMRLSPEGDSRWQWRIGGFGWENPEDLVAATDGGYLIAGEVESYGSGGLDGWIVKVTESGRIVWQRAYGTPANEAFLRLLPTRDGGYLAVGARAPLGEENGDAWVVKLDRQGNILWQRAYGGPKKDFFTNVLEMADGGYLAVGFTTSFSASHGDGWVVRLDREGRVMWQRRYGTNGIEWLSEVARAPEDSVLVGGGVLWPHRSGSDDIWLMRLGPSGNVIWQKTYGSGAPDQLGELFATSDGRYLISGTSCVKSTPHGYQYRAWLADIDFEGALLWQKRYAGGVERFSSVRSLKQGDGYLAVGRSWDPSGESFDAAVMRLSGSGLLGSSCSLEVSDTLISGVESHARATPTNALTIASEAVALPTSGKPTSTKAVMHDRCN